MTVDLVAVSDRLTTDRVVHCLQTAPFPVSLRRRNYGMWRGLEDADEWTSSCLPLDSHSEGMREAWFALLWACHGQWSPPPPLFGPQTPELSYTLPGLRYQAPSDPNYLPYKTTAASAIMPEMPVNQARLHLYPSQQSDRSYLELLPTWVSSRMIVLNA